jgi:hypothetical protein
MTEAEWLTSEDPERLFVHLLPPYDGRKWRLFVCACCRRMSSLMPDARSRAAVEASEGFADGLVTLDELEYAHAGAHSAALRWFFGAPGIPYSSGLTSSLAVDVSSEYELSPTILKHVALAAGYAEEDAAAPQDALQVRDWVTGCETAEQANLFRDVFGNPFRPVDFSPAWRTDTAVSLAKQMYESRDFGAMPILADALQDAGCDNEHILSHCRGDGPHVRGCWVVDLVLGKE